MSEQNPEQMENPSIYDEKVKVDEVFEEAVDGYEAEEGDETTEEQILAAEDSNTNTGVNTSHHTTESEENEVALPVDGNEDFEYLSKNEAATEAGATPVSSISHSSYPQSTVEPQGKIFVGGLGRNTTNASLKEYFQQYGNVLEAVVIVDKLTGRSRGFGFATFESKDTVKVCLEKKHYVDGVAVDVRSAVPREEARDSAPYDTVDQPGRVFVGGLSEDITEDTFREHFSQYGALKSSNLMYDKDNHKPRGFGFVIYENPDDVDKCIGVHEILGRNCEAKKALPRPLYNRNRQSSPSTWQNYNDARAAGMRYGGGYSRDAYDPTDNYGFHGGYGGYYDPSMYNSNMAAYYAQGGGYNYGYANWPQYNYDAVRGLDNYSGSYDAAAYAADRQRRATIRTNPY